MIARWLRSRTRVAALVLLGMAAACSDLPTGPGLDLEGDARGVDVSHWQGSIDWRAVEAEGIDFGFVKATEGATFTDPAFAANWSRLAQTRIVRGAYHYFRPGTDAARQAEHFVRTAWLGAADLPPVLDVETTDGVADTILARGVRTWLEAVERATGKRPIIYTYRHFWDTHLAGQLTGYPLWIANYGASEPGLPLGWTRWAFWQHSETGYVPGIATDVDLNWFNGSEAELRAFVQAQGRAGYAQAPPGSVRLEW